MLLFIFQPVVIGFEGKLGNGALFDGKANLKFADQNMEVKAKIADLSRYNDHRYTTEWHLTHPGSFLDVQLKTDVGNSAEAVSGNMEVNYMTTYDRQMKTMAIRSEINKLREELNMEVKKHLVVECLFVYIHNSNFVK